MRAATRSAVNCEGASTIAPVRLETARRMSERVELLALIVSRPLLYVTCGGTAGICSGVGGAAGGGCTAGCADGFETACLYPGTRGFRILAGTADAFFVEAAGVCAAAEHANRSREPVIAVALRRKRVIPKTRAKIRPVD
jgi:hypothetical protein